MPVEQPVPESISTATGAAGLGTQVTPAPAGVNLYDTLIAVWKTNGTKKMDTAGWAGFTEVLNETSSGSIGYGVKLADASDVSLSAALGNYTFTWDTTTGQAVMSIIRISGARRLSPADQNTRDNGAFGVTPYNAPALPLTHENSLIIRMAGFTGLGGAATVNWTDAILNTNEIADFQSGTSSGMAVSWEAYPGSLTAVQRLLTFSITPSSGHWNGLTIQVIGGEEHLSPNAIAAATNLSGAVTDIDEPYDVNDASWLTSPAFLATQSKTWYMMGGTLVNGMQPMQENGVAPADAAFATATGWIVGAIAAGNYSGLRANTERATSSFGAGVQPQTETIVTGAAGNAFRTPTALNGTFDAGNWVITAVMRSVTAAMLAGQTYALRWRVYASANADGTGARQLTSGDLQGNTVAGTGNTTANHATHTLTWAAPLVSLNNEYLFFVCAIRIVALSGTGNTRDTNFRQNTASKVVPTTFRPKEPDGSVRVSFATPSVAPKPGTDLGRIATRMRLNGIGAPTANVVLVEGGVDRASLSYVIDTTDPGEIHADAFFNPSAFADPTGAGMEVRIDTTNVGGGTVEVGAIELMYAIPRLVAGQAYGNSQAYALSRAVRLRGGRGYGNPRSAAQAVSARLRASRAYARAVSAGTARGGATKSARAYAQARSYGLSRAGAIRAGRAYGQARSYGKARGGRYTTGRAYGVAASRGVSRARRDRLGEAFGVSVSRGSAHPAVMIYSRAYGKSDPFGLAHGGRSIYSKAYGLTVSYGHTELQRVIREVLASAYGVAGSAGYSRPHRGRLSGASGAAESYATARAVREVLARAYGVAESYGWITPVVVVIPGEGLAPNITVAMIPIASGEVLMIPIAVADATLQPTADGEVDMQPIPRADAELRPTAGADVELEE